ncbi:hypothetical protein QQP08_000439 [Theobroma cacao]|nr:hypothetical protein QQP08_000439 [Theobroma cacao]
MSMALKNFFFATLFMLPLLLPTAALDSDGEYKPNPNLQKPYVEKEKLLSTMIGIQGLVYCRSGSQFIPLEGAVARITCQGVDKYGYETESFSILSCATDAKGYFIATVSPYEVKDSRRLRECKAFLELSPSDACDVPTDANQGITGAPLASYHLLHDKNMKLFTVGPFFFIPQKDAKSIWPDGY